MAMMIDMPKNQYVYQVWLLGMIFLSKNVWVAFCTDRLNLLVWVGTNAVSQKSKDVLTTKQGDEDYVI